MWFDVLLVILLTALSGVFAGLTLALFSITPTTLERKIRMGDKQAEKIYPIRIKGNQLLCTLLLGNVTSYTIMAIFLGSITQGVVAGFIATGLIFVFGEILPQAIFPRYAMWLGAKSAWFVKILLYLFYPLAAPIAWLLDQFLGKEPPVLWSKKELEEIIRYHEDVGDGIIDEDEERIILGALSFSEKKVSETMVPVKSIFSLSADTPLSAGTMNMIRDKGYRKIPVVSAEDGSIIGLLHLKDLVTISTTGKTVSDLCKPNPLKVTMTTGLDSALNLMVEHKIHMVIVEDENGKFVGLTTLQDIVAEILKVKLEEQID